MVKSIITIYVNWYLAIRDIPNCFGLCTGTFRKRDLAELLLAQHGVAVHRYTDCARLVADRSRWPRRFFARKSEDGSIKTPICDNHLNRSYCHFSDFSYVSYYCSRTFSVAISGADLVGEREGERIK